MSTAIDNTRMLELIGDPREISHQLQEFRNSTDLLSSEGPRMIDQYPKEWVAIYGGRVVAHALEMPTLLSELDDRSIPRSEVVVRFIERDHQTMVL